MCIRDRTMAIIMVMLSSQPVLVIAHENALDDAAETDSGDKMPQMMKLTTAIAVTENKALSSPNVLRWFSTPMPGTRPGCMSWG